MRKSVIIKLLLFLILISFLSVDYASGENQGNAITWDKTFDKDKNDVAYSIIQTKDGGYAVTGWTKSKGTGNSDVWVIKLNENGNLQ